MSTQHPENVRTIRQSALVNQLAFMIDRESIPTDVANSICIGLGIEVGLVVDKVYEIRRDRNASDLMAMREHVDAMFAKFDLSVFDLSVKEQELLKADVDGMVGALQILLAAWGVPE